MWRDNDVYTRGEGTKSVRHPIVELIAGIFGLCGRWPTRSRHGPFEAYDLGDFELEQGGKIGNLQLAYATFGELSPQKDYIILIASAPTRFRSHTRLG